ncbi:MAG: multidrug transporter subunit MdtG, partial [Candidatus Bathyarchaeia archaeon]
STPPEHAGVAVGLLLSMLAAGIVVGPPLFGLAVDLTHSYPLAWQFTALSMAIATTLIAVLVKEKPHAA